MKKVKYLPLKNFISYISRGITPKYTESDGICVLNQKCIRNNRISIVQARKHNIKAKNISNDKLLRKWDILVNSTGTGTLGRVAQIKQDVIATADSHITIVRPNQDVNAAFLGYALKYNQQSIEALAEGSTGQTELSKEKLKERILIPCFEYKEQAKISEILLYLDERLELNEKINQNLESQAQAIFKSWFVDFEPFKNGKFVDSELGKIPEGWRVERLGAVCECVLGGTPSRSRKEYWEGNIPWINSGKTNEFRVISPSEFISAEGLKKSATKLLPKKTTILAITGATLGQVSLLEIDACANQSVVGILENNLLPYEYIYMYVSHNIEKIISHQTGGAQQHINKDNIKNFHIILPPQCELKRYTNAVENLYSEITNLVFQSRRLWTSLFLYKCRFVECRLPAGSSRSSLQSIQRRSQEKTL